MKCPQCGHDTLMQQEENGSLFRCAFCGHEEHRCPECGSEMGFIKGFPLTPNDSTRMRPEADDHVFFNYTHAVCPNCGYEEKFKDGGV